MYTIARYQQHSLIVIYMIAFILMVQSLFAHTTQLHIYMAQFPLLPLQIPLCLPFCPFPLTWHPPVVTGIVHLRLRLLVNWPYLPHPSPNCPTLPKFPEPQLPRAQQWRPREYSGSCYPEHYCPLRPQIRFCRYVVQCRMLGGQNWS